MIARHAAPNDFVTGIPPQVRTVAEAAIDLFLSDPLWRHNEVERTLLVRWADYGGLTQAKARGLYALLNIYRNSGGWDVVVQDTSNDAEWVIIFGRR